MPPSQRRIIAPLWCKPCSASATFAYSASSNNRLDALCQESNYHISILRLEQTAYSLNRLCQTIFSFFVRSSDSILEGLAINFHLMLNEALQEQHLHCHLVIVLCYLLK